MDYKAVTRSWPEVCLNPSLYNRLGLACFMYLLGFSLYVAQSGLELSSFLSPLETQVSSWLVGVFLFF